ncbi:putative peroxisomal ABC transporter (PXA1) [Aspergillus ibericus CBS 121593]|uniref:ABC transporter domain-containing protein n=1 Tax=Aspergillus ibericus CBS 121593 TaxID=1448316 RepID=A0A395GY14_9EURO|nr:hypothetical protein BO80DRAFT_408113 [Aspergillus ibericus CBS 121593]RAL00447.1 hypothetical protein BO80DRAFT_408113 [Aspergillus ibericus CBS 121593]
MAVQSTLRPREDPLVALFNYYAGLFRSRIKRSSKTTKIIATLALILSILSSGYGGYKWFHERAKERARGSRLLRRNSGIRGKDGTRTIYVPYKDSMTSKVKIYPTKQTTFEAHRRLFLNPPAAARVGDGESVNQIPPPTTKPGLNLAFLHQFLSLGSIMVPRWGSKETGLLMGHGLFLLLRTYLSLLIARLDGEIVRDLVSGKGRAFTWGIIKWCGIGTLASYTNAMIKFLQSKVSIAFRTRLTRYIHDLYLTSDNNYYKLMNLDGSVGQGPDQFITQDLTLFCSAAAALYSSMGKPMVDLFVFNYQLYRSLGPLALTGILTGYFSTAAVLRKLSPPFGKLKAVEGKKEGDFRGLHARLLANAEEISFYGGADIERVFLARSFKDLQRWMEGIYSLKIRYNMLEDVILKYAWSAFGYLITSLPIFLPAWGGLGGGMELVDLPKETGRERDRMKEFITNKRLMLSLADAGGRMMYSIKDISELAGYTSRVYSLISTLHRVHANAYYPPRNSHAELYSLADVQGTIHNGFDGVRLEQVPVVAPSLYPRGGDELLESLSFVVHSGDHLLISGPNGVGKSAIARVVSGLWPVYRGLVSRPRGFGPDGIMFLPQRPYLSVGTLRDQVIYPHTAVDMHEAGITDAALQEVLDDAHLGYLPGREGGWDCRKEWKDVLSGGEKQRMALARIYYHEPRYAFLDEGTSAVSSDVEGLLYQRAKERGITLITISTRASLKKYHTYNLSINIGDEGEQWEFERIGTAKEKLGVEKELQEIRKRLDKVEEWKRRREEIEDELRKVWIEEGELAPPPYEAVSEAGQAVEEAREKKTPEINPLIMSEMIEDLSSSDEGNRLVIAINQSFSDGTESSWPTEEAGNRPASDKRARVKLAKLWLQETGAYQRGVNYILDRLPDGYALFDRPRQANPEIWRMAQYGEGLEGCQGDLVDRLQDHLDQAPVSHLADHLADRLEDHPGDHREGRLEDPREGHQADPQAGRSAVLQLKQKGSLELDITEPASMDWRAERTALDEHLQKLDMQPSFLPRAGEVVLWTPDFEGELAWNPEHSGVQIYSPSEKRWLGTPEWRAGIISQSIKPFGAFEHFLQNIPREGLHPSVEYAMTIMSSFSLLDKYYFKGTWPDASIYCRGIFLGAELLVVGDAVRLKPAGNNEHPHETRPVTDVMVIEEIRLELKQCDDDIKSKHLAETYQVRIRGKVYTTSHRRVTLASSHLQPKPLTPDEVVDAFHTVGMNGYGEWYPVHPGATVDISQDMILGRLYEPDALQLMFGSLELGYDHHGVASGRAYSRQADERIPGGRTWFWGDFRTQTLAIDSLNGEDVGHYSDARNVKMWQANLRVLDGTARPSDLQQAKVPGDIGRPSAKSRLNFAKVGKLSKLVSMGLGATDMSNPVSSAEEGTSRLSLGDDDEETEEEDFTLHIEQLRGGTEETEEGDYLPDQEPQSKRARRDS